MKLEPSRASLSGRPEFLRPPAPVQTSAIPLGPRFCASCGVEDVVHLAHEEGGTRVEHSVTIELRYLKKRDDYTPRLQAQGWKPRIHQGREAMERFMCRPCIAGHEEMDKEFRQKRATELRSNQQRDTYYTAVCGE